MQIQTIGSYEAKTKLPELLRQVQNGTAFEISVRGHVVARLSPVATAEQKREEAAAKMLEFMREQQSSHAGAGVHLRELIEDGRA